MLFDVIAKHGPVQRKREREAVLRTGFDVVRRGCKRRRRVGMGWSEKENRYIACLLCSNSDDGSRQQEQDRRAQCISVGTMRTRGAAAATICRRL